MAFRDSPDFKEQLDHFFHYTVGDWIATHKTHIVIGFYVLCIGFSLLTVQRFLKDQKIEDVDQMQINRAARDKAVRGSSQAFAMLDESEDED